MTTPIIIIIYIMSSSSASASPPTLNSRPSKSKLQEATKVDMFSYYSNDARRMRKLLLKEDEDFDMAPLRAFLVGTEEDPKNIVADNQDEYDDVFNCEVQAKKRRRSRTSRPINEKERKTRLSFEIHPSLMMYDMLLELDDTTAAPRNLVEAEDEKKAAASKS